MPSWPHPSLFLLVLLFQSAVTPLSADNTTEDLQEVIVAAILPLTNTDYAWAWPRVAPALYQAIEQVNSDPWLLPGLKLRLVHGSSENQDGYCSDSIAPLVAVDLKLSYDPWAFIGPGCDYSSSPVARFTTHWDVPMVTAGARAIGFNLYAAVTNTGPTHQKLGEFGVRIQEMFGWQRHATVIFTDNKDANDDRLCYFTVEGLYELLGKRNITVHDHVIEGEVNYKLMVQEIRDNSRGQMLLLFSLIVLTVIVVNVPFISFPVKTTALKEVGHFSCGHCFPSCLSSVNVSRGVFFLLFYRLICIHGFIEWSVQLLYSYFCFFLFSFLIQALHLVFAKCSLISFSCSFLASLLHLY